MEMGDVYHIRGLKLSVGTGPENSSILTSKDHDVSLEKHSLLLLVPAQWTIAQASGEPGTTQPESSEPAARIPAVTRTAALPPGRPSTTSIFACRRSATWRCPRAMRAMWVTPRPPFRSASWAILRARKETRSTLSTMRCWPISVPGNCWSPSTRTNWCQGMRRGRARRSA